MPKFVSYSLSDDGIHFNALWRWTQVTLTSRYKDPSPFHLAKIPQLNCAKNHHWTVSLLGHGAFEWKNSCEHCAKKWFWTEENMTLSTHYTEGKHRKSLHFPAFTHINLTRKCMFLAANSGEYIVVHSENAMFPNFGLGNFSLTSHFQVGLSTLCSQFSLLC